MRLQTAKILSAFGYTFVFGWMSLSALKNTIERIRVLEAERKTLLLEIDELKKKADAKALVLEKEVTSLRDEVKSLRVLLNEGVKNDLGQTEKQ